jgi:hypothetical protein
MEFKKLSDNPEYECSITFDKTHEQEVVRAVYREHITKLAQKGNIGSISKFDRRMSGYGEDEGVFLARFRSSDHLIEQIEDFHNNTDSAVTEIALENTAPAYDNPFVADRLRLGESALRLAQAIRETAITDGFRQSLDQLPDFKG